MTLLNTAKGIFIDTLHHLRIEEVMRTRVHYQDEILHIGEFAYDLKKMRTGKAIAHSQDSCVLPPKMPSARKANLKYVLWAVPLAVLIGSAMKSRRRRTSSTAGPVRTSEESNSGHG